MQYDHRQVRAVFLDAVEREEPSERAAFLQSACADDAELRRRVEGLLRAHDRTHELLDEPLAVLTDAVGERPGTLIGPYKLLEQIGEGGFGVVFMAEQQLPVRRKVALKVLKPGMDTRQVVARFEAERQALALMNHPNIAQVFDGGTTESGRPFFVMELVGGVAITEYCDGQRLAVRERLRLFVSVCRAVQHAHHKGVIHRDLKPSNILVTRRDDAPVVKVIDFGIAKATGQVLTDKTLFTNFAQFIGTPMYMSPEQAQQGGLDVDTRSDIYSLGVLLYELLTGTTPFDSERLRTAACDELRRIIREEEPAKPSTRLSALRQSAHEVSSNRRSDPGGLTRLMRGDLDWIVMKAMEKDRNRRYDSAGGFAADVQRYLDGDPVVARPPSPWYRLSRFGRKHAAAVLATGAVMAALLVGTGVAVWQAAAARRAQREAEQAARLAAAREEETGTTLEFVESRVFAAARPSGRGGGLGYDVTLRQALESARPYVRTHFADQPLIEARLSATLAESFRQLGEAQTATELYQRAYRLNCDHREPDAPETLACVAGLASAIADLGRNSEALRMREDLQPRLTARLGADHLQTLAGMRALARNYFDLGRFPDSLRQYEIVRPLMVARLGTEHPQTLACLNGLADCYDAIGRHAEGLSLREKILAVQRSTLGPTHPDTLQTMAGVADSLHYLRRTDECLRLREEVFAGYRANLGVEHPHTLIALGNLARVYADVGRHAEAVPLFERALAAARAKPGSDRPEELHWLWGAARSLIQLGRGGEAVPLIDECVRRVARQPVDVRIPIEVLSMRLDYFEGKKDAAGCRATAEMWEGQNFKDGNGLFCGAAMRAVASGLYRAAGEVAEADTEAERAMHWLQGAIAVGFHDRAKIDAERRFDSLRERDDFRELVAGMK